MSESKSRLYAYIPSQPQHNTGRGGHYKLKNMINKKMKENKYSLRISHSNGNITINGDPIPAHSYNELKILKNLLTKVLDEVNEYIQ